MDKTLAKALRSDTKADLLSSAPPPVMAEALQLNEETVTSGRQLIARPAGSLPYLLTDVAGCALCDAVERRVGRASGGKIRGRIPGIGASRGADWGAC
jgi:hypothetical protein